MNNFLLIIFFILIMIAYWVFVAIFLKFSEYIKKRKFKKELLNIIIEEKREELIKKGKGRLDF